LKGWLESAILTEDIIDASFMGSLANSGWPEAKKPYFVSK